MTRRMGYPGSAITHAVVKVCVVWHSADAAAALMPIAVGLPGA